MGATYTQDFADDVTLKKRKKSVSFRAMGLTPNSNVTAYINETDVSEFVMTNDVIQIQYDKNSKDYKKWKTDFTKGHNFRIYDGGVSDASKTIAKGKIDYIEQVSYNATTGLGVANVYVYLTGPGEDSLYNTKDTERVITANTTYLTIDQDFHPSDSANNKILAYYPKFSLVNVATSNTVQLTGKFVNSNTASDLVGKTIYIVSGDGAGQNATISAYNTSTRTVTINGTWDLIPGAVSNTSVRVEDRSMVRIGGLVSDSTGTLPGMIMIPSIIDNDVVSPLYGWKYWKKWRDNNWHNRFKLYKRNVIKFSSDTSTTIGVEDLPEEPTTPTSNTSGSGVTQTPAIPTTYAVDPFAQTFFVDERIHPQGVSITSVKLLFKSKDSSYPVQIQIRPTIGGVPAPSSFVMNGATYLQPDDIKLLSVDTLKALNVSGTNPFSNTAYYTEAKFNAPVFLDPGKEYAIVIASASSKHEVYISNVGSKLLGTNRIISTQPYLGVLYKMQNASQWEPFANEDLCFELTKARYSTTVPMTVDFNLKALPVINGVIDVNNAGLQGMLDLEATAPTENVNVHAVFVSSSESIMANTGIDYSIRMTKYNGELDSFMSITPDTTKELDDNIGTRVITSNNKSFVLRAVGYTNNPDIAPTIDLSRLNLITATNIIDDNQIANSDIFITNFGAGYSNAQNVIVTLSGGGGTGATAKANVVNGIVDKVYITNAGEGYTSSPTIIISKDTTATVNAEAVIIGEDQPNGGIADAKYITRKITLADGFNGGDLRVLFSAYKPTDTEIDVYYKVLSQDDADNFDNKRWTKMTLIGGINSNSISRTDYKKYIYAPGINNIADNFINYDGFTNFKYFAVKVVFRSRETTKVPKVKDFRAIALAELL